MSASPSFIESREWQAEDILPLIATANPLFPELEAARANPPLCHPIWVVVNR